MTATDGTRNASSTLFQRPFMPESRPVSTGVPSASRVMIGSSPGGVPGPSWVRNDVRSFE